MAAREGEAPLTGLQRSRQPGPLGDAQFPTQGFQDDIGAMIVSRTSFGLNTADVGAPNLIRRGPCTLVGKLTLVKPPTLEPLLPNRTAVLRIMGAIPAEARVPQRAEALVQRDFAWHCPDETSPLAA